MFHCDSCKKEFRWSGDYDLDFINKLPLINPEADKFCSCGGNIVPGFTPSTDFINISLPGDKQEYYNMQIGPGPSKSAQQEFLRDNPGEEINERGAVKIKGYKHQKTLLKKLGMCEL